MALDYDKPDTESRISPILEELLEWLFVCMRNAFYPESSISFYKPDSVYRFCDELASENLLPDSSITRLKDIYDDLLLAYDALDLHRQKGESPPQSSFDTFANLYEAFTGQLRRLEIQLTLTDTGMDLLTGLKTRNMLLKDLEREMERINRHGNPFTIVIIRIDDLSRYKEQYGDKDVDLLREYAASLIKRALRNFDDAYVYRDDAFVMTLKHSDVRGAEAAIKRMRQMHDDSEVGQTLSFAIGQPIPGDDAEHMIDNLIADLDREIESDVTIEYKDVSFIEQYVKDTGKKNND